MVSVMQLHANIPPSLLYAQQQQQEGVSDLRAPIRRLTQALDAQHWMQEALKTRRDALTGASCTPRWELCITPAELCRCWHHGHSLRTLGAHALLYGCLAAGQLRCQLCAKVVPDHKILAQHLKDKHDRESADDSAAQTPEPNLTFSLADLLRTQRSAACIPPTFPALCSCNGKASNLYLHPCALSSLFCTVNSVTTPC